MFTSRQVGTQFTHDFYQGDKKVASLKFPDVAVATNARLKGFYPEGLNKEIEVICGEQHFTIRFEYLKRAWNNDVRFTLMQGESRLAVAEVVYGKKRLPVITLTEPFVGTITPRASFFRIYYDVFRGEEMIGKLFEASMISLNRSITIDLPESVAAPVQFFFFFLVYNHAFS